MRSGALLPHEPGLGQDGEGGGVLRVGDRLDAVQRQVAEGQVDHRVEGVRAMPRPSVFRGEQEDDLRRAVGQVLIDEADVADRRTVGEQHQEVVAVRVVDVALDPLAEPVQGPGPDAGLVRGHRLGPPPLQPLGVVDLERGEGDLSPAPTGHPFARRVRRRMRRCVVQPVVVHERRD